MRSPKPWYWKARKTWCVYINSQKHVLGPNKERALDEFHDLMSKRRKMQRPSAGESVVAAFLQWTKENRSEKTYRGYKDFCEAFQGMYPDLPIDELNGRHVTAWLDTKKTWNSTT